MHTSTKALIARISDRCVEVSGEVGIYSGIVLEYVKTSLSSTRVVIERVVRLF